MAFAVGFGMDFVGFGVGLSVGGVGSGVDQKCLGTGDSQAGGFVRTRVLYLHSAVSRTITCTLLSMLRGSKEQQGSACCAVTLSRAEGAHDCNQSTSVCVLSS